MLAHRGPDAGGAPLARIERKVEAQPVEQPVEGVGMPADYRVAAAGEPEQPQVP